MLYLSIIIIGTFLLLVLVSKMLSRKRNIFFMAVGVFALYGCYNFPYQRYIYNLQHKVYLIFNTGETHTASAEVVYLDSGEILASVASPHLLRLSSNFGIRYGERHEGVDIARSNLAKLSGAKIPIMSIGDGVVMQISNYPNRGYGKQVIIQHSSKSGRAILELLVEKLMMGEVVLTEKMMSRMGTGVMTHYAHLNKLNVKKGDFVKAGSVIGLMGETGHSRGVHLHLEVRASPLVIRFMDNVVDKLKRSSANKKLLKSLSNNLYYRSRDRLNPYPLAEKMLGMSNI